MPARGNASALSLGPGYLFWGTVGITEPVDLDAAWDPGWIPLGYTNEGSSSSYNVSSEPVEVAEELEPLDQMATSREIGVSFSLAEITAENFKRAMNGGTITVSGAGAAQVKKFEPPALGSETACAIGFESEDHKERWVWRQCKQTGSVETSRNKGADKSLIPVEFSAFKPAAGGSPFMFLSNRGIVVP